MDWLSEKYTYIKHGVEQEQEKEIMKKKLGKLREVGN